MIFATLNEGGRDGTLLVVDRGRRFAVRAGAVAPTLQAALDDWDHVEPELRALTQRLHAGDAQGAFEIDRRKLLAPLPRGFAFFDAACYPEHMAPIRQARGMPFPPDFYEKPMMYEGCSAPLLSAHEPLVLDEDLAWGVDVEAEVAILTGEVPPGTKRHDASRYIRLLVLYNDYSLRHLQQAELKRGFGFLQSKTLSSLSPFAVTPDELGSLWTGDFLGGGRYVVKVGGQLIGDLAPAQDAIYNFCDLIEHAAFSRPLMAGTLIAAGTVGNKDRARGCGCLAELRAREQIAHGDPRTPFLRFGDEVSLDFLDDEGVSVFGEIRQSLERSSPAQ